jgi:hypothetical protein
VAKGIIPKCGYFVKGWKKAYFQTIFKLHSSFSAARRQTPMQIQAGRTAELP